MTALLLMIAFLLPLLVGFLLICPTWEPGPRPPGQVAFRAVLAPGVGIGVTSLAFFLWMVFVGAPGRGPIVIEAAVLLSLILYGTYTWRHGASSLPGEGKAMIAGGWSVPEKVLLVVLLSLCLVSVTAFLLLAMNKPHGGWDAWAIWNRCARFLYRGGDRWTDAFSVLLSEVHPDYPLLGPGFIARAWSYMGTESVLVPAAVGFLFTFSTVGFLVWAVSELRGRVHGMAAGILLLGTSWFLRQGASQYMDIPIGYYFLCTVALLFLQDREPGRKSLSLLAGMTAGMACWVKNEGVLCLGAVLVARALAVLITSRDWKPYLRSASWFFAGFLPIFAVVAYFKLFLAPPTDMVTEFDWKAVYGRLSDPFRYGQIASAWGSELYSKFPLVLPVLYLALSGVRVRTEERGGILAAAGATGLMTLIYFFVYVITPKPLQWHLGTSLSRLLVQLWPTFLFTCFLFAIPSEPESIPALPKRDRGNKRKGRKSTSS